MQKYINSFSKCSDRIIIGNAKDYDVQDLLKRASLLVTDYSSVFFDFAYLGKPIIFYQFDEEKFRAGQYNVGYFDYKTTELGEWTDNLDGVLDYLNNKQSLLGQPNKDIAKKYFKFVDTNNSQRIYEEIKNGNKNKSKKFN